MRQRFTPTMRISISLMLFTLSLVMVADILGLIPDENQVKLEARANVAESLAVQLSSIADRNNFGAIKETIDHVVQRNPDVLSVALRRKNGSILVGSIEHSRHWIPPQDGHSTPTHVQVPLYNGKQFWGLVEISFRTLSTKQQIFGIPISLVSLIGFLGLVGFVGYYCVLRRALKELDPSRVVPERVQAAFNTLAEGVLILDEREAIILANKAFSEELDETPDSLFGMNVGDLAWRQWVEDGAPGDYPWRLAIRDKNSMKGVRLGLRSPNGAMHNFTVNTSPIVDGNGAVQGCIVTFDDITEVELKNEKLNRSVQALERSRSEINRKNKELQYLATRDSLTGVLNRRALFEQLESRVSLDAPDGQPITLMMLDLDHFKNINDSYGHVAGDKVIVATAELLKSNCRDDDFVGRYGGEEFCIVLVGPEKQNSIRVAERIRHQIETHSIGWSDPGASVTASIGISWLSDAPGDITKLVKQADAALYAAKEDGRNRVICFHELSPEQQTGPGVIGRLEGTAAEVTAEPSDVEPAANAGHGPGPSDRIVEVALEECGMTPLMPTIDPVTQLPTRVIFMDRVAQSIARAQRHQRHVAVLQVTIESYTRCTDLLGYEAGQHLIKSVAQSLSMVVRQSDTVSLFSRTDKHPTVSRLEVDKFAIEVSDLDSTDSITWIVKRIFDALSHPIEFGDQEFYITCNVGISLFPGDGADAESLVRKASTAERHANEVMGPNSHMFYSQEMNDCSHRRITLEAAIRQSLEHNQLTLYYQPIVAAKTGRVLSAEVLMRSDHPQLCDVPAGLLISIAEQAGLMADLGTQILLNATQQFAEWINKGLDIGRISVNLSAAQLRDTEAREKIIQIVSEMEFDPRRLQFEVTESALIRDIDQTGNTLRRLQQLGVQIALDDFGTGYSSLSYLRKFQVDTLKIDRSFIDEITNNRTDANLVSAIIAMSHQMGITVVAEGVETAMQMECLKNLECDQIQGYFIARPQTAAAFEHWLRSQTHNELSKLAFPQIKRRSLWSRAQTQSEPTVLEHTL